MRSSENCEAEHLLSCSAMDESIPETSPVPPKEVYPIAACCAIDPAKFMFATMQWGQFDFIGVFCAACRRTVSVELMGARPRSPIIDPNAPVRPRPGFPS